MKFTSYLATAAAAFGIVDAQCNANNCARAVTGTRHGPVTQSSRRADCSSYQRTTVTLASVTETVTIISIGSAVTRTFASSTVTTTTTVTPFLPPTITIDLPEPTFNPKRREIEERQITVSSSLPTFAPIPFYASACAGPSAYRSACSCWGITPTFIFASVDSTTTITFTSVERDTITVIGTGVTTTTVRVTSTPDVSSDVGPSSSDEPTATSEEPVSSTDEPASSTEEPASSTEEPASSTEEPASSTEEPVSTTDEPTPTSSDEPASTTDEPPEPASSTEEPASSTEEPASSTEEPASSTEEPASTTEEPASSTDEPPSPTDIISSIVSSILSELPSITEEPVTTTDDPIISLTFFTETEEPSTTEPFPSLPTTFVTSFTTVISEDPSSVTSSDAPTSSFGADVCSTFGPRFPYTPFNLITGCTCTYDNPVCGEGFATGQRELSAVLTIESCANVCDTFSDCAAFSYNPQTLQCRALARGSGIGSNSSSTWVFVDRLAGTCSNAQCT
ncbi:hypothetical protein CPLU01_15607 [Colletotrichum plurivorum]|uniref:Apple domain-containing protein n=1 Tax=Colletotrichum plurivorum TaxID=2175906 RepID=A0A8H6MTV8_9PEZI|nr:hypothetical protein CPLU01_15607 [Colletotrichum plurivorum]